MAVGGVALLGCGLYFLALFAFARFGDRHGAVVGGRFGRTAIYLLGCTVFASSFSYYTAIELVSLRGLSFLYVIAGPVLLFAFCNPLIARMADLVRSQNITSVADFIAARYGKAASVALVVTVLTTVAVIAFLAVQIKIIAASLALFTSQGTEAGPILSMPSGIIPIIVVASLAAFATALGTRQADATEHQRGLMLVVAGTAIVKLLSFIVVGVYVTWGMFDGLGDLGRHLAADPIFDKAILSAPPLPVGLFIGTIGALGALIWPQQFHATLVESPDRRAVVHTAWFIPLYTLLMAAFVVPLAIAGHAIFPNAAADRDLTILALPLAGGSGFVAFIGLIGGLSASTGSAFLVLVTTSFMFSNDVALPLLLRTAWFQRQRPDEGIRGSILAMRRLAIVLALVMAYVAFRIFGDAKLVTASQLAVGCILLIATVCIGGLIWRRATARGAMAGLIFGALAWCYTLLLPVFAARSSLVRELIATGPFGFRALRPTALFGLNLDPVPHGMAISFATCITAFIGLSLTRRPNASEGRQAALFARGGASSRVGTRRVVTVNQLEATVAHYLGEDEARRLFAAYRLDHGFEGNKSALADHDSLLFAEHRIASVIGSASSHLVIDLLSRRQDLSPDEALRFVDQVSVEKQSMLDFLRRSISLTEQGMSVYDSDFRLLAWSEAVVGIFDVPPELCRVGTSFDALIRYNAEGGPYSPEEIEQLVASRRAMVLNGGVTRVVSRANGRIYESRAFSMVDVGLCIIYLDVDEQAKSEEEREAYNETLEQRVRERTEALEHLNAALAVAKAQAEEANLSKTRFLAAASHDLLQPLNAARLYASCLMEKMQTGQTADEQLALAVNMGSSLGAVEDILTALLDISRLDAGAAEREIAPFRLHDILHQLKTDFEPVAREKRIRLVFVSSSAAIVSDRRLLRRLLQNLISNAIKYTAVGRVIVGVRRFGSAVRIEVWDTGIGIPLGKQRAIFEEFERLPSAVSLAPGVGLGLAIVERLGRVLGHPVSLRSKPGWGSVFSVTVPVALGISLPHRPAQQPRAEVRQRSLDGLVVAAVDNDPTILLALTALLEEWDCRVVTGADLDEIQAALQAQSLVPDAIVADYHLGDGDGIAVIKALRARYGPCHAILATADRSSIVRDRAGADNIRLLNKPLKPAVLRSLLSQWRIVKMEVEEHVL